MKVPDPTRLYTSVSTYVGQIEEKAKADRVQAGELAKLCYFSEAEAAIRSALMHEGVKMMLDRFLSEVTMPKKTDQWLIWSMEHDAFWGAGRVGYTKIQSQAGRYGYEEAVDIVVNANYGAPPNKPNEAMMLYMDLSKKGT
jgi:hypothetical protein